MTSPFSVKFQEAIEVLHLLGKNMFHSGHWTSVWKDQHITGFTIAESEGYDILGHIHAALLLSLKQGKTERDFIRLLTPILQNKDWWGYKRIIDPVSGKKRIAQLGNEERLKRIFHANMNIAHATGRWLQQQEVKTAFPYLRYVCLSDSQSNPVHRGWHGTILHIDHPWWWTHYPPNARMCRCEASSVSRDDLKRFGWRISKQAPDDGTWQWTNPRTGAKHDVPVGIEPGWDYNPGVAFIRCYS